MATTKLKQTVKRPQKAEKKPVSPKLNVIQAFPIPNEISVLNDWIKYQIQYGSHMGWAPESGDEDLCWRIIKLPKAEDPKQVQHKKRYIRHLLSESKKGTSLLVLLEQAISYGETNAKIKR